MDARPNSSATLQKANKIRCFRVVYHTRLPHTFTTHSNLDDHQLGQLRQLGKNIQRICVCLTPFAGRQLSEQPSTSIPFNYHRTRRISAPLAGVCLRPLGHISTHAFIGWFWQGQEAAHNWGALWARIFGDVGRRVAYHFMNFEGSDGNLSESKRLRK